MSSTFDARGVVFCGGASRRMGTDKALLAAPASDRTLLERAVGVLAPLCDRVVLACGESPRYGELGLDLVLDRVPGAGPLGGLAAALGGLDGAPASWLCALACDMPRVGPEVFEALLERARDRELDACLLESEAGVEPLCAVYHERCRPFVERSLLAGERRMISFHGAGVAVGTLHVGELSGGGDFTTNVNTRDDYERELDGRSPGGEDS